MCHALGVSLPCAWAQTAWLLHLSTAGMSAWVLAAVLLQRITIHRSHTLVGFVFRG